MKLSAPEWDDFESWICQELQAALDARSRVIGDGAQLDQWQAAYEQQAGQTRRPWADAADLPSYIPTEKTDSLRSRLVQVVFGPDPVCVVEGYGLSPVAIAKCEAFHQLQAENEQLQVWLAKAFQQALIQGNGILQVDECYRLKKTRGPFDAAAVTDEYGSLILGEDGQAQPQSDDTGKLVAWQGEEHPKVSVTRESVEYVCSGPEYHLHSLKDFLYLPGHAKSHGDVWGYAMRSWLLPHELEQRVKAGIYDKAAVETLPADGDRDDRPDNQRTGVTIAAQEGPTAEIEVWQVHLLRDIDDDGIPEWLVCAVSLRHSTLLRVAYDDLDQARFVSFTPFPRHDSVYGYSFVGHKLGSVTAEHTSTRNMAADRSALATSAPMTVLSTSTWDPDDEPWGVGAKLTVRSHEDIKPLTIPDVPQSVIAREQMQLAAAERLSGLSDVAMSGATPDAKRTATEINTVSNASYARVDESVKYIQESLETLYILRHRIYQRMLESPYYADGLPATTSVANGLSRCGVDEAKGEGSYRFTRADLPDNVRFKPKGSVETANKIQARQDIAEAFKALTALAQTFPQVGMALQQNPRIGIHLANEVLRLYGLRELQLPDDAGATPMGMGQPPAPGLPPMLAQGLPDMLAGLSGGMPPGPGMVQ